MRCCSTRRRIVLAHLELVADHGHLGVEVLARHEGIDHAVGFQVQRPAQVLVRGREGLEVVGAVERGGAVRPRATLGQFLRDVRVLAACP